MADEYFTLVFKGSLREFKGNPLRTETPFGIPFVCAIGDLSKKVDDLESALEWIENLEPSLGESAREQFLTPAQPLTQTED